MLALFCRNVETWENIFCAPSKGGGIKTTGQGLRALRPVCADESQRPDLIHTADSGEHKHVHTCRKVPAHAQTPEKTANVAQNKSTGAQGDTRCSSSFANYIIRQWLYELMWCSWNSHATVRYCFTCVFLISLLLFVLFNLTFILHLQISCHF